MADQEDNKMPPPDDIPDVVKAYNNDVFLQSKDARSIRLLSEYLEPESRFEEFNFK